MFALGKRCAANRIARDRRPGPQPPGACEIGMRPSADIKRRADGSIDFDHYTAIGRRLRAEALTNWLR